MDASQWASSNILPRRSANMPQHPPSLPRQLERDISKRKGKASMVPVELEHSVHLDSDTRWSSGNSLAGHGSDDHGETGGQEIASWWSSIHW